MKNKIIAIVVILLIYPLAAMASEITVVGAANVQFTLDELKAEFTKETGIDVKTVIGSSGKLSAQIENGAPFDVFLSADMKYPSKLYTEGFSLRSPKVYAKGTLILWTMKNFDLRKGINILSDPKIQKIAIANPDLAPYGRQAINALKYYKLYEPLQKELVTAESISQANEFISTGAADIGFTAKSVVLAPSMKDKGQWIEVDSKAYEPIAQGVIVLKYGDDHHSKEAHEFYDFLFSVPAKEIFKKYGYQLP